MRDSRVNVKAFIDQRSMSSSQWSLLALCFLVVAIDGMDVAVMGFLAAPSSSAVPLAHT